MIRLRLLSLALAIAVAACSTSTPTAPTSAAPHVVAAAPTTPEPTTPTRPQPPSNVVAAVRIEPASLVGGAGAVGTVTLTTAAPAGGTVVTLSSSDRDVEVPATVTVLAGQTTITFGISTHPPHSDQTVRITATASGVSQTGELRLLLETPGARSDEYTTAQGAPLVVAAPGILDNDTRRSGHDLIAELVMGPMSGTLTLLETGGFTYRPNLGFHGRDRFIYRALDGQTYSNPQHVWITVTAAGPAPPPPALPSGSQTFGFTGAAQTFTVPAGVTQIVIEALGAQGGNGLSSGGVPLPAGAAGLGGYVQATLAVTPGTLLQINVGGKGANGALGVGGGGGGGGASDVRTGGFSLADRLVIAGGGGGGGNNGFQPGPVFSAGGPGGAGGELVGVTGGGTAFGAGGGAGGSQAAGGAGGGGGAVGAAGTVGVGGLGAGNGLVAGGFNGGGNGRVAGGGGGGTFGGGGGGQANSGGGGGGGSSFVTTGAAGVTHLQGFRTGDGLVVIRW